MMKTVRYSLIIGFALFASSTRGEQPDMTVDALATLTSQVENLTLNIGISLSTTNYGLRSITLFVNEDTLFEPEAEWPDGTPVSAHALITQAEALHTVKLVSDAGLFRQSTKTYSGRMSATTNTPPPPQFARDMQLPPESQGPSINGPSISFQYVTFDEHWYSYYSMAAPWNPESKELTSRISQVLSGGGKRLTDSLILQMNGVQPAGGAYVSPAAGDPSAHP